MCCFAPLASVTKTAAAADAPPPGRREEASRSPRQIILRVLLRAFRRAALLLDSPRPITRPSYDSQAEQRRKFWIRGCRLLPGGGR